jgi:hypothetical protein
MRCREKWVEYVEKNNSYFLGLLNRIMKNCILQNILMNFDTKLENRLQDQDQSICDGKVTEEECSNAINNIDNYRPISLLNVDLKLLPYGLAQRLKKVLEKIVNNDQTGYIKNRFIGFNHRQIQDIIDFAESYNVEGAIVFVDFKKAFDSLEWTFILTTLKHFGFNESFIN